MKIKYRIVREDDQYFVEQKTGFRKWVLVSDVYTLKEDAFDWLKETTKEVLKSTRKPEVLDNYVIDNNGLRRNMYVGGKLVSAYYPLTEPTVPKPSR